MKRALQTAVCVAGLSFLAACSPKAEEPKAEPAKPAVAASAPAAAIPPPAPQPTLQAEDIPVTADFEEEATASITAKNYAAELDALEKELAAE